MSNDNTDQQLPSQDDLVLLQKEAESIHREALQEIDDAKHERDKAVDAYIENLKQKKVDSIREEIFSMKDLHN